MTTIVEFIEARIAEDEQVARATHQDATFGYSWPNAKMERRTPELIHSRRHDPARVLRQCEALRRAVAAAQDLFEEGYSEDDAEYFLAVELGDMAAIWLDHPDYRERWSAQQEA